MGRGLGTATTAVTSAVFAPFRTALYLEDRYRTFTRIKKFFYNEAETAGILPSLSFVSGFGSSFGATAFHKDIFGHEERASFKASYGPSVGQEYQIKFELPHLANNRIYIKGRGRLEHANNLLFQGIGNAPDAMTGTGLAPREAAIRTRYQEDRWLGLLSAGAQFHPRGYRLRIGVSGIGNRREFDAEVPATTGISLGDVYDTNLIEGFGGFDLLEITGDVVLDTRHDDGPDSSGLVLEGFAGGPVAGADYSYAHYGAEAAAYVQPWYPRRMLVARLALEGVRGAESDIPFTELPRLGGAGLLRGYRRDRYRDKLAAIGTFEYHYPIHANVSGQLFLEVGKVASTYDQMFGGSLSNDWHRGYGGGLLIHSPDSIKVRFDVAYGEGFQFYFATDVLEAFHRRGKEL